MELSHIVTKVVFLHLINQFFNQVDTYCALLALTLLYLALARQPTIIIGEKKLTK